MSVIKKFFEQLTPEQRSSIKTVSGDGARWIDESVTMYVPHAKRCADPFHVILWCSAMLDSVRLRASRELKKNGKKAKAKEVKGAHIALGKDPSDLSEKQKAKIDLIAQECPELYQAYKAKEELRQIMKEAPEVAKLALNDWCERMKNSDIKELQELEKKIFRHYQNICNTINCATYLYHNIFIYLQINTMTQNKLYFSVLQHFYHIIKHVMKKICKTIFSC